jgi:hypothetical protein
MMAQAASVVLAGARTLLNDDSGLMWTDAALLPKLSVAHRELQTFLRLRDAAVMKATSQIVAVPLSASQSVMNFAGITDLDEPISLVERPSAGSLSSFIPMTEKDILPDIAAGATLTYWRWYQETIVFPPCTVNREVRMEYWRNITPPANGGASLVINNAEMYMTQRVAALAALSVNSFDKHKILTDEARVLINQISLSNGGRSVPLDNTVERP